MNQASSRHREETDRKSRRRLLWHLLAAILLTALAAAPAGAQEEREVRELRDATLRDICGGENADCTGLDSCAPTDDENIRDFACFAVLDDLECAAALERADDLGAAHNVVLSNDDYEIIALFYEEFRSSDHSCVQISRLQEGWLATALILGQPQYGEVWRWGLQVLPSFSVGIPFAFVGEENDATKALRDVTAVGGIFARVTPMGFWSSVHVFIGTTDVASSATEGASSPALLLFGAGVDGLGGSVALTWVHATLREDGLFSRSSASTDFFQVGIDLSALAVTFGGMAQGD